MSQAPQPIDANEQQEPRCSLSSHGQDAQDGILPAAEETLTTDDLSSVGDFSYDASADVSNIDPNPVTHNVKYYVVPLSDMVYNEADEQAREWYVISRGVFIGVFKYAFYVDQATRKVTSAHGKKEDSLREAVDHFNAARASGWMRICTRPDHIIL